MQPGHPHAGGEIWGGGLHYPDFPGPSPRGWGNRQNQLVPTDPPRAIPTRVGKSYLTFAPPNRRTGHPHAGGEIVGVAFARRRVSGPSPRGWGNLGVCCVPAFFARAIPTRVGKSIGGDGDGRNSAGHPHAGGEINNRERADIALHGPSPRGWGNLDPLGESGRDLRAIPTRVGKSLRAAIPVVAVAGHPHAGGEIMFSRIRGIAVSGPSPRGWGNQLPHVSRRAPLRAIPTRVGKSIFLRQAAGIESGHPHAGGEIADTAR